MVIDELSSFKSTKAKRWRLLKRVAALCKIVWGLTGTPASNGYGDLFAEMYLIDGGAHLGKTLTAYRDKYFRPGARKGHIVYEWLLKPGAKERIDAQLGTFCLSMKAVDWLDMPARVDVPHYVHMSSAERKVYDQFEREKVLEKSRQLVGSPGSYTRATHYGAAQFVKGVTFDRRTGEVLEDPKVKPRLDQDAIDAAAALDGYYLIVTSETGWDDGRVIDTYRELWRIEESFKVTKSEIVARPVYVWTPAHIEAHFLTCYIALVILRLLQLATGLPCSRIREEIAAMNCVNVDANWWVCTHRTDDSDRLVESVGLEGLKLKNLRTSDAKAILAKAAKGEIPHKK
jgi:hypothetical protein